MIKHQRLRLKKVNNCKSKTFPFFIGSIFFSFVLAIVIIFKAGKNLEKSITDYATIETKRVATAILNDVIRNCNFSEENLYEIVKNNTQEIELINYNSKEVNNILSKINKKITKKLLELERGETQNISLSDGLKGKSYTYLKNGVVCDIPVGSLTGNSLLINTTMTIPLRFSFVGSVKSNLDVKVTSYGLNNALVELSIIAEITEQITLPHTSKEVKVSSSIPIVTELIQGKIPYYYQGGLEKNSNLS